MKASPKIINCIARFSVFALIASRAVAAGVWTGAGGNGYWNTAGNWDNSAVPGNIALTFGTVAGGLTTNDIASLSPTSITITNGPFTLSGNAITLGGNITASSGALPTPTMTTINLNIALSATRIITTGANGRDVTVNGVLSSTGGWTKAGNGTNFLTAVNTFTGTLSINAGAIMVNTISNAGVACALGAGTVGTSMVLGNNGNPGTLYYTGTPAQSTDRQIQIGSGTVTLTGGANILNNGGGALTFVNANFNTALSAATALRALTLSGSYTAGVNEIQGVIADNNTGGGGTIAVTVSANTWKLSGANTCSGGVTLGTSGVWPIPLGTAPGAVNTMIFSDQDYSSGPSPNSPSTATDPNRVYDNYPEAGDNHGKAGNNVAYCDGHVEFVPQKKYPYMFVLSQDQNESAYDPPP